MFAIAQLIIQDAMRRHTIGARGTDPVVPERAPRRRRRSRTHSAACRPEAALEQRARRPVDGLGPA